MANRRPLVLVNGQPTELPTADTLSPLSDQNAATADPTGFESGASVTESYDSAARTVTLTQAGGVVYWWRGERKVLASPWTSPAHPNTDGGWFLSTADGTTFAWSTTPWAFQSVQVAFVLKAAAMGAAFALRETHGLMPCLVHEELHKNIGTYRYSGGTLTPGTFAVAPASPTDADNTPGVDSTTLADEDNHVTLPALAQGSYKRVRLVGAVATAETGTTPFRVGTTYPLINSGGAEIETANGRYFNVWGYAVPTTDDAGSQAFRWLWVQPQREYTSLASAQAETVGEVSLGDVQSLLPEFLPNVRITFGTSASYNGASGRCRVESVVYLTTTRPGTTGAAPLVSHAATHALTGSDPVTLTQSQVTNLTTDLAGKEAAGTAASTMSAHVAAADPHPQYRLESETVPWASLSGVPSTFTPSAHVHAAADVTSGTFASARIAAVRTLTIEDSAGANSRAFAANSRFGYSATYRVLALGSPGVTAATDAITIALGVDANAVAGGAFSGNGNEVLVRRALRFLCPNAGGTDWENVLTASGNVWNFTVRPQVGGISIVMPADLAAIATSGSASNLTAGTVPAARMPALTGDVTTSAGAVATTIANDAVTYAKMQNVSAASKLLGSGSTAGAQDVREITLGTGLSMSGDTLNATAAGGAVAAYYAALSSATPINITAAGALTANRWHTLTGSSGGYTVTLPAVGSSAGAVVGVEVAASNNAAWQFTIDAGAGVGVAGRTQSIVVLRHNTVLLVCDGVRWTALALNLDTPWQDDGALTIEAVTTNPTKGGSPSPDKRSWRRSGSECIVEYRFNQTVSGTNGTGHYLLTLPFAPSTSFGLVADSSSGADDLADSCIAVGAISMGQNFIAHAMLYDSTRFRIVRMNDSVRDIWGSSNGGLGTNPVRLTMQVQYPVNGW